MTQYRNVPVHMPNHLIVDPTNCVGGIAGSNTALSAKDTLSARDAVYLPNRPGISPRCT